MKIKFYLGFAAALLLTCSILGSCSKSDDEVFRTSNLRPPEVTGYYVRNIFGEDIRSVGTPNVKLGEVSNNWFTSSYYITGYPNPANGDLSVSIKDSTASLKKIWLVPANSPQFIHNDMASTVVIGGTPVFQVEINPPNTLIYTRTAIDITSIPNGFYKLYVLVNGHLLHDNILIQHK